MIFKRYNENKVFPFLVVDDFYTEEEQKGIWEDIEVNKKDFVMGAGAYEHGIGIDENNSPIANLTRIYLDQTYTGRREESNILRYYSKNISDEVIKEYSHCTPSCRTYIITNSDSSQISYYGNGCDYKEHSDSFMHTCLTWFYKEPKKFTGGNLSFTESDITIECKHNRMILFPSYYLHKVDEVKMTKEDSAKGLGRYCLTHFYTKNN